MPLWILQVDGVLPAFVTGDHQEGLTRENGLICHWNAVRGSHGSACVEAGLGPNEIGLTDRWSGKYSVWRETLEELELRQGLIREIVEPGTQHVAFDRVLIEDAVEPLYVSQLLAALGVHRVTKVWPAVESMVYLPVAVATQRDAVAGLEFRFRQEDLPADMMRRKVMGGVTVDAAVVVALANELAPPA
jgi:hypothetical protein